MSVLTREEDMLVRTDTEAPLDITRLSCVVLRTTTHGAISGKWFCIDVGRDA